MSYLRLDQGAVLLMNYVHEYIWYVLGAAALIAFLLAWIIRGAMSSGKRRRATVERDIALTELEQVRNELDSLYAAQRKQKETTAGAVPSSMEGEIRDRDEQIKRMSDELASAKASLQTLRETQSAAAEPAVETASNELTDLRSRNTSLEGEVETLQAQVRELTEAAAKSDEATPAQADTADEDKLVWQVDYLKSRVAALEEQIVSAEATQSPSNVVAAKPEADTSAADEELARLRWRNRYLEGRLAYFEERPEGESDEGAADEDAGSTVVEAVEASPEQVAESSADNENDAENDDVHPAERMLEALGSDDEESADEAPSPEELPEEGEDGEVEDVSAEADDEEQSDAEESGDEEEQYEGIQPLSLETPNGEADDLTLITGIGPRIQTILNDYGIWHFSQIADWSPENEAWIDRELNFAGRVSREGWIGQAKELAGVPSGT